MCKEGLFVYTKSYFICIMIIGIMSLLFWVWYIRHNHAATWFAIIHFTRGMTNHYDYHWSHSLVVQRRLDFARVHSFYRNTRLTVKLPDSSYWVSSAHLTPMYCTRLRFAG